MQGVLQHRYDVQGNRTETQMPDGRTLRYLYYGSGHLQQINLGRDVISEFTRDHLHREVQRSQGRLDTRRMYDRTGRLTRKLTCKGMRGVVPETFIDREYAYSGQDELLKKRHSRQGVTDYFYDTTGRITACRNEAYLDSWQYDAAANLLDRRQGETAQAGAGSVVPFNRITSYRGLHYRYDEYGRVVEKRGRNGTQHYRWDAEHRLTEVAVIRGSTVRRYGYVYDAPGRRVEKHELDAEGKPYNRTTFLWDGMRLAQECRLGRSSIGKFISGDPISIRGGINLYQYAPNPISWIDPFGLSCGKVGKVEYRNIQRTKDYTARLLKNRSDFRYVSNYLISKYKASLRVTKVDAYGNKYRFFDGKDINGNRIEIEIAHTGHRSVNGGMEPPHMKVKTKDANNKTTNIDKYFLEEDIYRILDQ